MTSESVPEILHEALPTRGVFFIDDGGRRIAEMTYTMSGDDAIIDNTFVEPARRGAGLGERLVEAAVEWARRDRRKLVALCSFAKAVLDRHPEYDDVRRF